MDKVLAKYESGLIIPPDKVIFEAKIAVTVFKGVIEQKPKKVIINGEQFLEYEDWQTLGEFYRCSAITRDAVPVEIDGVKGAKAHADLVNIDTGVIIGGAEAYCLRDEQNWGEKPWFQLASMAQTRAGAKAFRNRLAWVAVMAGYRPTPAEEMTGTETHPPSTTEHYCLEHKTSFFKRGKMKSYAHPIGDSSEWCHERTTEVIVEDVPKPPEKTQDTNLGGETPPSDKKDYRDPDTLKNFNEYSKACIVDFPDVIKTSQDAVTYAGYKNRLEISNYPEAYRKIVEKRQKPPE